MSELKQTSVALLERAIDDKIRKAVKGGQSTHLATVTRVGNDGTTWVQVYGGADETPVRRMTTAAQVGDVINVTFSGLSCMGVGNVSSPSATERQVTKVANEGATAIAGVMRGILQIRRLIADKITTGELDAEIARILNASIDTATVNTLNSMYANVNLANVVAADVDMAVIKDLVAESGLFQDLVITGDGTITGKLGAVLVDGDTARFSNIYADALKILGEDGLYHALNMAGLSEGEAQVLVDAYGEALDGGLHGSHLIAESVTATEIDVTSLIAAMLLTQFVQVGASAGTHIEAKGDRFSFFSGGSGWKTMAEDYLYPLVENPTGNPFAKGWYEQVDKLDEYGRHVYMRTLDTEPWNAFMRVYEPDNYAGRNLLKGTGVLTTDSFTRSGSTATVTDNVLRLNSNSSETAALYKADLLSFGDVDGKTLTLSCDVRIAPITTTRTSSEFKLYIGANKESAAATIFSSQNSWWHVSSFTDIGSDWSRLSITVGIPDDLDSRGSMFTPNATSKVAVQFRSSSQKKPVEVRNIKLEFGPCDTAYSVAYEDINPSESGLYEIVGDAYVPSNDTVWSADKAYYSNSANPSLCHELTVTTDSPLDSITVYGRSVQSGEMVQNNAQVMTPTPSSPVSVEVVEPAQLLTFTAGTETVNGITSTIASDGTWTISGTAEEDTFVYYTPIGDVTLATDGYLMISGVPLDGYGLSRWRVFLDASKYFDTSSGKIKPKWASAGDYGCCVQVRSGYTMPTGWTAKPMLVRGSVAKDWTPYGKIGLKFDDTVIPVDIDGNFMASLPDGTRDELIISSTGALTLTKRVGVFDASSVTTYSKLSSIANWFYKDSAISDCDYTKGASAISAISNRFAAQPYSNSASLTNGQFAFGVDESSQAERLAFKYTSSSTAAQFNTWIASNQTILYYPLETPQTIDLGTITMPDIAKGSKVSVVASLSPLISAEFPKQYYGYNVSAASALPGEVAYIAVDPDTNESTFYMTRSVVVKDLRFGDWLWYGRRNRNMSLKWIGGEV